MHLYIVSDKYTKILRICHFSRLWFLVIKVVSFFTLNKSRTLYHQYKEHEITPFSDLMRANHSNNSSSLSINHFWLKVLQPAGFLQTGGFSLIFTFVSIFKCFDYILSFASLICTSVIHNAFSSPNQFWFQKYLAYISFLQYFQLPADIQSFLSKHEAQSLSLTVLASYSDDELHAHPHWNWLSNYSQLFSVLWEQRGYSRKEGQLKGMLAAHNLIAHHVDFQKFFSHLLFQTYNRGFCPSSSPTLYYM